MNKVPEINIIVRPSITVPMVSVRVSWEQDGTIKTIQQIINCREFVELSEQIIGKVVREVLDEVNNT